MALIVCMLLLSGVPEHPFAKLTGPFAVGTHEYHWVDESRDETLTKAPDDHRLVSVRVWYPADVAAGAECAPYIHDRAEYEGTDVARYAQVQSRAVLDAPFAEQASACPVLVYHHGAGWTRFSSSFATEDLASHGYVVFGVDHLGLNQTRKIDGRRVVLDGIEAGTPPSDPFATLDRQHFPLWLEDSAFVLDRVGELNDSTNDRFFDRLDLERVGMFGWSFGGAASIQAARDDPRVKAAIDMDGTLFGDVAKRGCQRPIMLMHSAPNPGVDEKTRSLLAHSTADWYDLVLAGSEHGHYSDIVLFTERNPSGIDPALAHRIICEYVRAFFDKYLRGEAGELLAQDPSPFAEATVRRGSNRK